MEAYGHFLWNEPAMRQGDISMSPKMMMSPKMAPMRQEKVLVRLKDVLMKLEELLIRLEGTDYPMAACLGKLRTKKRIMLERVSYSMEHCPGDPLEQVAKRPEEIDCLVGTCL